MVFTKYMFELNISMGWLQSKVKKRRIFSAMLVFFLISVFILMSRLIVSQNIKNETDIDKIRMYVQSHKLHWRRTLWPAKKKKVARVLSQLSPQSINLTKILSTQLKIVYIKSKNIALGEVPCLFNLKSLSYKSSYVFKRFQISPQSASSIFFF